MARTVESAAQVSAPSVVTTGKASAGPATALVVAVAFAMSPQLCFLPPSSSLLPLFDADRSPLFFVPISAPPPCRPQLTAALLYYGQIFDVAPPDVAARHQQRNRATSASWGGGDQGTGSPPAIRTADIDAIASFLHAAGTAEPGKTHQAHVEGLSRSVACLLAKTVAEDHGGQAAAEGEVARWTWKWLTGRIIRHHWAQRALVG